MKINHVIILFIAVASILLTSCNTDDPTGGFKEWNQLNVAYLTNMKDSVGYVKDTAYNYSGQQFFYYYKITLKGDSTAGHPVSNSYITANYRGSLITGKVFDQTYVGNNPKADKTATPVSFFANQLIPGWTLNLIQMSKGEIRTIILPQELGYGAQGVTGAISPYSTLRFDIQLISFSNTK